MKRLVWLPAVLCILFSSTARAQDTPAWEVSGGYSYVRANVHGSGSSFALNGGVGSITQNVNGWFGARVEAGFFTGKEAGRTVTAQTLTYGPVFSIHKYERVTPFVDVQLGTIHGGRGYLGRLQGNYLMSRFLGLRQDNLQGIVGLVLRLGRK